MLKLEKPHESHREMYEDIIAELERDSVEFLHPASTFTYRNWNYLELVKRSRDISEWKIEGLVPADLFFAVVDNTIVWAIQLRHHIDHPNLIFRWGHIGYWVRPSQRKKWYASKMLEQILEEAKKIWLRKLLITCDVNNVGSNKVIQKNGGILEKECTFDDGSRFNRYWINL